VADGTLRSEVTKTVGSAQEALWILEHVESHARSGEDVADEARALASRRAAGEPLQYLLGSWPFRTLELSVTPSALIPRPETEQVVEAALRRWRSTRPGDGHAIVVDLGTGTGAIGLSLLAELADETEITVWLTDRSPDALELARVNAGRLGAEGIEIRQGEWFAALDGPLAGSVHLMISNPPYVAERDRAGLDPVLSHEPDEALFSADSADGVPGFSDVETLIRGALPWLAPGGVLAIEMAENQVEAARGLATSSGFVNVETIIDLAGKPRGVVGEAP